MALNIYTDASQQEQQLAPFCKTITGLANNFSHFGKYALAKGNPNLDLTFKTHLQDDFQSSDFMQLQAYEHESGTLKIELSLSPKLCCSKNAGCYVVAAIQEAVDAAANFFEGENIQFQKEAFHSLVNTVSSCSRKTLH